VGEFAFVLFAFGAQLGVLDPPLVGTLMAVTALSMTATPVLLLVYERVLMPRIGTRAAPARAADVPEEKHAVIIAGFSHFGSTVGRFLRANGVAATVLDNDSDRVDLLRRMGFTVYYGDVTRPDLLEAAGAGEARLLISAVEDPETARALIAAARKHFPHLELLVRARHRFDAYEYLDLGVRHVYRHHLDTSVRLGVDVLRLLGHRAYTAYRAGQQFMRYDEAALARLAAERYDMNRYIVTARAQIAEQEALLLADREIDPTSGDGAWDSEELRQALGASATDIERAGTRRHPLTRRPDVRVE
jgi:CPA2 family monovalent cation:H+ antiporter-2